MAFTMTDLVSRLNTNLEYQFLSAVRDVLFSIFAAVPVPKDVQQCHTLFNKWGRGLLSKSIKNENQKLRAGVAARHITKYKHRQDA
jgi:hypothetical protein